MMSLTSRLDFIYPAWTMERLYSAQGEATYVIRGNSLVRGEFRVAAETIEEAIHLAENRADLLRGLTS